MNTYVPLTVIEGAPSSPPPFAWQEWYEGVGGRTIDIPEADTWMSRIQNEQYPRFEGHVEDVQTTFASDAEASAFVKGLAFGHGADIVGICAIEPTDVYKDRTVTERYAIVMGMRMQYASFVEVPSEDAAVECLRIYHTLGESVIAVADDLRAMGIACRVEHPLGDSSVLHVPLALKAGFGELGRHGSIINPTFGPLFRIGSILTDLPLAVDSPLDAGIAAFCDKCQACRIFCPADAIPDSRDPHASLDPIGKERYLVDTGKCFPYFARRNYCSACLAVCAYEHKKWALMDDGTIGPYPAVPFASIPPASDVVADTNKHYYPKLRRDEKSPYHR
ncbi:MAG: reductive dehalogenase domain-containing protein [bacterium]|nr:reductive dehalogenase domain-containing protein [bacterium]